MDPIETLFIDLRKRILKITDDQLRQLIIDDIQGFLETVSDDDFLSDPAERERVESACVQIIEGENL
jgi:hypothetical protein